MTKNTDNIISDLIQRDSYGITELLSIMKILRERCPWDKEQTHKTIRNNFLEEAYEAAEAIDEDDTELLREELGDVLLQVVFHSEMEQEKGSFSFDDVADGICKKLIHRHPHIFAQVKADTTQQVLSNWDAIKREGKGQKSTAEAMEGISKALPALVRAEKIQAKAAKMGFDFPDVLSAVEKIDEETLELRTALRNGDAENTAEEIGDLLFAAVNVARLSGMSAEQLLEQSSRKFYLRFKGMESALRERNIDISELSLDKMEEEWVKIKSNMPNL
ncbi:MAG: nucleoside triphosphate pyrophosphohydrolase [Eubacteriales bacterium]